MQKMAKQRFGDTISFKARPAAVEKRPWQSWDSNSQRRQQHSLRYCRRPFADRYAMEPLSSRDAKFCRPTGRNETRNIWKDASSNLAS